MTVIRMSRNSAKPAQDKIRNRRSKLFFAAWHTYCTVSLTGCLYMGPPWIPDDNDQLEVYDVSPDSDTITKTGNNSLIVEILAPQGEPLEIRWLINDFRVLETSAIITQPLRFFDESAIHTQYLDMGRLEQPLTTDDEIRVKARLEYGAFEDIHNWTVRLTESESGQ